MFAFVLFAAIAGLLLTGLAGAVIAMAGPRASKEVPLALWPALGLALSTVLTLDLAKLGLTAPLTPIVVALVAVTGLALGWKHLHRPRGTIAAAALTIAPILLGFGAIFAVYGLTLTGYLSDTTAGVQAQGADWLMRHGGNFASAPSGTTVDDMLRRYFVASSYPAGSHAELGLLSRLSGQSTLSVYNAQQALTLAASALGIYSLVRTLGGRKLTAVVGGIFASCGALVVSYALMGSIKELTLMPGLIALSVLVLRADRLDVRGAAVLTGLLAIFAFGTVGTAGAAWAVPAGGLVLLRAGWSAPTGVARLRRTVGATGLALVVALVTLGPQVPEIVAQTRLALALSQTNAALAQDPGNLTRTIGKEQALGIWLAADHRNLPVHHRRNKALELFAVALAAFGLLTLIAWRRWWGLAWFGVLGALWLLLTARGTMWIDAKLVVLNAPFVAVLVVLGAEGLARRTPRPTMSAALLLSVVGAGILLSDESLLRGTGVAPMSRYRELDRLDAHFAGKGPAFLAEFDEYALDRLPRTRASGLGYAETGNLTTALADGTGPTYGASYDVDRLTPAALDRFPLVLQYPSPLRSAPPSNYRAAWMGRSWNAFARKAPAPLLHLPIGQTSAIGEPTCQQVDEAVAAARVSGGAVIARVATGPTAVVEPDRALASPSWARTLPGLLGPGSITVRIPPANQRIPQQLWIDGSTPAALTVTDQRGRVLGALPHRAGGNGNAVGPVTVPAGTSQVTIGLKDGWPRPGDRSIGLAWHVVFAASEPARELRIPSTRARAMLCGPTAAVDWIDVVGRPGLRKR